MPHRSLSRAALWRIALLLAGLSGAISALFWWLGAWPVTGFAGVEIGLAILLLRRNASGQRKTELVLLAADGLRIIRTDARGQRHEMVLPPDWLRVSLTERPGRVPRLALRAHGIDAEIAASLGEAEKRDLAQALTAALHRWRHPDFDNPQLRDTEK